MGYSPWGHKRVRHDWVTLHLWCAPGGRPVPTLPVDPPVLWLLGVLSQWDESRRQRRDEWGRVRTPLLSPTGGRELTPAPTRQPCPGSSSLSLPWPLRPGVLTSPAGTSPQLCTILRGFFPSSPHLCTLYLDQHRWPILNVPTTPLPAYWGNQQESRQFTHSQYSELELHARQCPEAQWFTMKNKQTNKIQTRHG